MLTDCLFLYSALVICFTTHILHVVIGPILLNVKIGPLLRLKEAVKIMEAVTMAAVVVKKTETRVI